MFRALLFSAVGAGLAVCVAVSALQAVTTEPLILHAETFEDGGGEAHSHDSAPPAAIAHEHVHDEDDWAPADGLERTAFTVLANLVVGVAVSLMLLGAMVLKGDPIDARRGLLWGAAGFAAASLLPALGLPPELPGTPAADILLRQGWWLATAAASAFGIFLMVFGQGIAWRVAGLALLLVPHLVGAPAPPSHEAAYPAGLAGEFVIASVLVSAVLWTGSGLAAGWLFRRLVRPA